MLLVLFLLILLYRNNYDIKHFITTIDYHIEFSKKTAYTSYFLKGGLMDTKKLLEYMENLRVGRKISQSDYLNEIVSQRHYYRYRRGETEIPFDILNKLASRLDIPLLKIIASFQENILAEKDIVWDLYNVVVGRKFDEANQILKNNNDLLLIDNENRLYYSLAKILLKYFQNHITNEELVDAIIEIGNYPDIMKKQILHDNEVYILGLIMQFSDKHRGETLEKLDQLRKNNKLLLSGNNILKFQIYFWIIKNYGRMSRFDGVIDIADMAIKLSEKYKSYYLLEYFYYYKALAFYKTGRYDEFEKELTYTIRALCLVDKHNRNRFFKTIEKDTDINVKEFIFNKLEKEFE